MRISIYSLIRLTALVAVVGTMTGVATHRLSPNSNDGWMLDNRQPWSVSNHVYNPLENRNLVLDLQRDRETRIDTETGLKLDLVSVSPFATKTGDRELVCRRYVSRKPGQEHLPGSIELVRMSFPSSKEIESREIDWLPNSPPAWDTRTADGLRTIFATGAGQLVRVDWTNPRGLPTGHRGELVKWQVEPPFGDKTFIGEPSWATGPNISNHLLTSIWGANKATGQHQSGLALLELNPGRTAIVGCQLLTYKAYHKNSQGVSFRFPVARTDPSGRTCLAWQEREDGQKTWSTMVADLAVTSTPQAAGKLGHVQLENHRLAASGCMSSQVGIDPELKYVYFIVPKSDDCYDGAYWRKARLVEPPVFVASAQGPASPVASVHRPQR